MESGCDIEGSKHPRSAVDRKMKSSRVGLTPRCYRMIELDNYSRMIELTRHHEWLQTVSLHEEHGVSEPWVCGKYPEIVVHLPMEISPSTGNIPRDGVVWEVRPPDDGCRRYVWGSSNTLIRWRGWRPGSQSG